jgi:alkylresorcinol/alkylpyrone synthase
MAARTAEAARTAGGAHPAAPEEGAASGASATGGRGARTGGTAAPGPRADGAAATSSPDPAVLSVAAVLPPNYADQETLTAALRAHWAAKHFNVARLDDLHRAVQVRGRHLALPLGAYAALDGFQKSNDAWNRVALDLGAEAVTRALDAAGLRPEDVDHLHFVTVTGLSTPSIDARLVNRLGLRRDVKRVPIFGLGCVAGAAGLARLSDALRAFPGDVGVLLSVELSSLTLQRDDASVANAVASGIFGDGAAAVVLAGGRRAAGRAGPSARAATPPEAALDDGRARAASGDPVAGPAPAAAPARPGPRVVATRSAFYRDTEWVMGWDFVDTGFKVVLSAQVPEITRSHIGADVDDFLAAHGLARGDVAHWIAHTGGPKVLQAFEAALELPRDALRLSWRSLEEVGNLSSASVLFVLGDLLASGAPRPGDRGLLVAMGPGFCAELVLLEW